MALEQFFVKNLKWITLALLFLFLLKSVQSCNRNTTISIKDKQYTHVIDSLKKQYVDLKMINSQLEFELKLQKEKAGEADKRAIAVQSVAEKIRANTTTTVNVRGAQIDTIKKK
jgi:uncharacterized membrane protein YhiD involved in acid resistance